MKKTMIATALLVPLLTGGLATLALAQQTVVVGIIQSVDPPQNTVTLTDGSTFSIAPRLSVSPLQSGDEVTIMYHQGQDGQKELDAFWIDAGTGGE
jgi:hypothetical protein